MIHLTGKFNWCFARPKEIVENAIMHYNGLLELRIKRATNLISDSNGIFHNPKTKNLCAMIGYISNLEQLKLKYNINKLTDVEVLEQLYCTLKLDLINNLDGLFSIILFDGNLQKGYIFQDEYGSNVPIYYFHNKTEFIFSTSLRKILSQTKLKRELNITAVYNFLYSQYIIPNKSTLVRNVAKLVPSTFIVIDANTHSFKIKSINRPSLPIPKSFGSYELIKSIENCTAGLLEQLTTQDIVLTLSAGYDSNLILHLLRKLTKNKLTALTIGGKIQNEIPQATSILRNYNNISHIRKIINQDIILSFPDIVWRTEGYVFSHAVFLQYELAKILSKNKFTCIFLGDGADQQLDFYSRSGYRKFLERIKQLVKSSFVGDLYFSAKGREVESFLIQFRRYPLKFDYELFLEVVLKKNGIMLHSFDIQGFYPFMNNETAIISKALGKLNVQKASYKENIKEVVGPSIAKHLIKQYGTTDIGYIFLENRNLITKVLKSDLIKSILTKSQIDRICNGPKFHEFILQLLYLYLFNELFISGKYDSEIVNEKIDLPLNNFF